MTSTYCKNEALLFGGTGIPFGYAVSNELHRIFVNTNGQIYLKVQTLEPKNPNNLSDMPPRMYGQGMYYTQEYSKDGLRVTKFFKIFF